MAARAAPAAGAICSATRAAATGSAAKRWRRTCEHWKDATPRAHWPSWWLAKSTAGRCPKRSPGCTRATNRWCGLRPWRLWSRKLLRAVIPLLSARCVALGRRWPTWLPPPRAGCGRRYCPKDCVWPAAEASGRPGTRLRRRLRPPSLSDCPERAARRPLFRRSVVLSCWLWAPTSMQSHQACSTTCARRGCDEAVGAGFLFVHDGPAHNRRPMPRIARIGWLLGVSLAASSAVAQAAPEQASPPVVHPTVTSPARLLARRAPAHRTAPVSAHPSSPAAADRLIVTFARADAAAAHRAH